MHTRNVSLTIQKLYAPKDGPIATVRFTEYDEFGRVHCVHQVDYYSINEMNNQIMTAINCGFDVDVRTVINTDLLEKRINSWT
tara:strand:- start:1723 stop:1971 length:249 start_codon:yes stop_codon:yes gene_type:complete